MAKPTRIQRRIVDLAELKSQPNYEPEFAFTPREIIQATLPYRNPGDIPFFLRENGDYALIIQPGIDLKTKKSTGYPYGSLPRLLLFWLTTVVIQRGERYIPLGFSLADFMRKLGLNPDNGSGAKSDSRRLRDQMKRLFNSRISFQYVTERSESYLSMLVASTQQYWWSTVQPEQKTFSESYIELGLEFFNAIQQHRVPLDMAVLKQIRHSPLALDLYCWLSYRTFSAYKTGKQYKVPWRSLMEQFGTTYSRLRDFRHYARQQLRSIQVVYPDLCLEDSDQYLVVKPCRPLTLGTLDD